jgi:comEA protein
MKKARIHPLILLICVFSALLIGFFLGRNVNRSPVQIQTLTVSSPAAPTNPTTEATEEPTVPPETTPRIVNINTATSEELQTLPGIGPVYAQRIIDYRDAHGPFSSVGELLNVEGIGPKRLEDIWDFVTTGG